VSVIKLPDVRRREVIDVDVAGMTLNLTPEDARHLRDRLDVVLGLRHAGAVEKAVLEAVAEHYKVEVSDLAGVTRPEWVVQPRHVAMFLMRVDHALLNTRIAAVFDRDHGTVTNAVRRVHDRIATNHADIKRDLAAIRAAIAATLKQQQQEAA
jgi:chromosomal replication initiation ATPase DnaA